ncbi:hypothetical protein GUITHDRAFT_121860 [Guillardia theta CCMP2712]|uniref:Uncharacterized protein n=1 Tax=Guillardia theta (strain CCMP2712) TaxID=905079 RepID=L1I6T4_GUITC|nr:hypothetical protein GUITHDRAFT_121860 [Guillardia theta CCMP2712]EKX31956.1 hypothetical protein GUITHDRAFT_121860 [Guillardia theta CCMP2712]|eukprot:XP_005818936.1 hypothetical protein GUITHDRAFT_121860 [Guillardia theta CCMP2712]
MISSDLRQENASKALEAVREAIGTGERAFADSTRSLIKEIIDSVTNKSDIFKTVTGDFEALIKVWSILSHLSHKLRTDDSFAYANAAKELLVHLEGLNDQAIASDYIRDLEDLINRVRKKREGQVSEDSKLHYQSSGFQHGKRGW